MGWNGIFDVTVVATRGCFVWGPCFMISSYIMVPLLEVSWFPEKLKDDMFDYQTGLAGWISRGNAVHVEGREVNFWASKNKDLSNWYLSLASLTLGSNRIGQWLLSSISGQCDWVGYQVMVPVAEFPSGTALQSPYECALLTSRDPSWYEPLNVSRM